MRSVIALILTLVAETASAQPAALHPARADACMPIASDYAFMWWANGSPLVAREKILCFRTGNFGLMIDVEHLRVLHFGELAGSSAADVVRDVSRSLEQLPAADLAMNVTVGGRKYHAVKGDWKAGDGLEYPYRLIDSGHFFQRADVLKLDFVDDAGEKLQAEGRLEIDAWPDRLTFRLDVTPLANLPKAEASIRLAGKDRRWANAWGAGSDVWKTGETQTVYLAVDTGYGGIYVVGNPGSAAVTATNAKSGKVATHFDPMLGAWVVAVPSENWEPADLDHLERLKLTLNNPDGPTALRLFFDKPDIGSGITGLCPMLRDDTGNPTGIPVQISKNWHRNDKRRELYDGPWMHGFSVVHLPGRSSIQLSYDMTYARWGGVPAASHAQLCLIGYGNNQLWEQSAIGSFGESICYDPDIGLGRSRIDDVRPLMVRSMAADQAKWTWTNNVGGGDFLVYVDRGGVAKRLVEMKTNYRAYGPNLTDVTYAGVTEDGCIAAEVGVSLPRCDDINRSFCRLHYEVKKPTAFKRLAFFQLGADHYLGVSFGNVARGDLHGLGEEFSPAVSEVNYAKDGMKLAGDVPWVSLHESVGDAKMPGAYANRGLIIRSWKARLGGKVAEPFAALKGAMSDNGKPSAVLELTPPPDVTELLPGDFVDAEVEMAIVPIAAADYYGPNANLSAALTAGGNTWKPVFREAMGNTLKVTAAHGTIEHAYPLVVRVDADQAADFSVTGGVGYVPMTFVGLNDCKGYELLEEANGVLTRVTQSVHGNDYWQTNFDPGSAKWEMVFNVSLDTAENQQRAQRFVFRKMKA